MAPLLPKTWLRLQNFTDFTVFKFNDDTNFLVEIQLMMYKITHYQK